MNGDGNCSNAQQYVTGVIEDSCLMGDNVVYSRLQWKAACVLCCRVNAHKVLKTQRSKDSLQQNIETRQK